MQSLGRKEGEARIEKFYMPTTPFQGKKKHAASSMLHYIPIAGKRKKGGRDGPFRQII